MSCASVLPVDLVDRMGVEVVVWGPPVGAGVRCLGGIVLVVGIFTGMLCGNEREVGDQLALVLNWSLESLRPDVRAAVRVLRTASRRSAFAMMAGALPAYAIIHLQTLDINNNFPQTHIVVCSSPVN
jgi:hypothetical protein